MHVFDPGCWLLMHCAADVMRVSWLEALSLSLSPWEFLNRREIASKRGCLQNYVLNILKASICSLPDAVAEVVAGAASECRLLCLWRERLWLPVVPCWAKLWISLSISHGSMPITSANDVVACSGGTYSPKGSMACKSGSCKEVALWACNSAATVHVSRNIWVIQDCVQCIFDEIHSFWTAGSLHATCQTRTFFDKVCSNCIANALYWANLGPMLLFLIMLLTHVTAPRQVWRITFSIRSL